MGVEGAGRGGREGGGGDGECRGRGCRDHRAGWRVLGPGVGRVSGVGVSGPADGADVGSGGRGAGKVRSGGATSQSSVVLRHTPGLSSRPLP